MEQQRVRKYLKEGQMIWGLIPAEGGRERRTGRWGGISGDLEQRPSGESCYRELESSQFPS